MIAPRGNPLEELLAFRAKAEVSGGAPNSEVLKQLLSLLHAPSMLPGGTRIALNACVLLRAALRTVPKDIRPVIETYILELRWVIRHSQTLAPVLLRDEAHMERFLRLSGPNPAIRGCAQEHGLWCLLWERHPDRALRALFRSLQQQALLAHLSILQYWRGRDEWTFGSMPTETILQSLYRRTLAIRHFAMPLYVSTEDYRSTLSKLPTRGSRAEYMAALRLIRAARQSCYLARSFRPQIVDDVNKIIGLLKAGENPDNLRTYSDEEDETDDEEAVQPGQHPSGIVDPPPDPLETPSDPQDYEVDSSDESDKGEDESTAKDETTEDANEENSDDEDEPDPDSGSTTYSRHCWSPKQKAACSEAGTHPADVLATHSIQLADRKSGGSRGWAEMINQLLPCSWENMAMKEVADGMELLRHAAERGEMTDLKLFTFANVILSRGLSVRMALHLAVSSHRPIEVDVLTLILPIEETEHAEWLIPAVEIPYRGSQQEPHPGCRRCVKFFAAPDYSGVGILMRKLLWIEQPDWNGQPIQPFAEPEVAVVRFISYAHQLKGCLMRENPDRGESLKDRFTFQRLGRVLFQRIYDQTRGGNIVLATYLTQQKHPCGEVTRYYDTPAVSTIQTVERRALASIQAELVVVGYDWPIDLTLKPTSSAGYVGSPWCPTIESVRDFLSRILKTIIEANVRLKVADNVPDMIARHNAYATFTYVGVTVGTCHRPSGGGMSSLEEIDGSSGMLSIVDKGANRARLSGAADAAVAQLGAYQEYVSTFDFEAYLGKKPTLSSFFLDPSGEVYPVSPATLKTHLPFAANFARHLARTVLAEWCEQGDQRLSPERLSALLGHSAEGEQPYGPHSFFDYTKFCDAMRLVLGDLLGDLGFRPITIQGKEIPSHAPAIRRILQTTTA